jgi:hypothetical protein
MKEIGKNVFAALALLISAKAWGALPPATDIDLNQYRPTQEQYARDIAELEMRGVLVNANGRLVLKDQSALEQLREEGRVDLVACAYGSICY